MNKQKGFAPILIIVIIAVLTGGYLLYQNQAQTAPPFQTTQTIQPSPSSTPLPSPQRVLTYKEAEEFIISCKVYSIGRSHNDLEKGYLSMGLRGVNIKEDWFKIDKNYASQINKKIEELTSSGKCPKVVQWME